MTAQNKALTAPRWQRYVRLPGSVQVLWEAPVRIWAPLWALLVLSCSVQSPREEQQHKPTTKKRREGTKKEGTLRWWSASAREVCVFDAWGLALRLHGCLQRSVQQEGQIRFVAGGASPTGGRGAVRGPCGGCAVWLAVSTVQEALQVSAPGKVNHSLGNGGGRWGSKKWETEIVTEVVCRNSHSISSKNTYLGNVSFHFASSDVLERWMYVPYKGAVYLPW